MTTDLSSLIERIEKSEGADRELDGAIALSLGWTLQKMKGDARPYYRKPGVTQYYNRAEPPAYTASIDAAMTLVEPRALWAHGSMEDGPFARICWPRPDGTFTDSYFETNCATVPLSICACALEARNPSHEG